MKAGPCITSGRLPSKKEGFTLLELLTVMAIMFILMAMALGAYFGFVRGSAVSGGMDNISKVLSLARQHAVTHRTRTYVRFDQSPTNSSYEVCAQAGVHDTRFSGSPDLRVSTPRWAPGELGTNSEVYNLTRGDKILVTSNGAQWVSGRLENSGIPTWNAGDRYGWLIHDTEYLPRTLEFDGDPDDVVFLPDGTTERATSGSDYIIKVKEKRGPAKFEIKVLGMSGLVSGG